MSFGDGDLHVENDELKVRVSGLESLVRELAEVLSLYAELPDEMAERIESFGIEVAV